jgi:hypothetical protein
MKFHLKNVHLYKILHSEKSMKSLSLIQSKKIHILALDKTLICSKEWCAKIYKAHTKHILYKEEQFTYSYAYWLVY